MKRNVVHFYIDPNAKGGPTTYIETIVSSEALSRKYSFACVYQMKRLNALRLSDIKRMVKEIKAYEPCILHVHGLQGEGFVGVLCGKLAGCKTILVTVHGMQHDSFNASSTRKFVYRNIIEHWTLRHADAVYCVCEATEKSKYIAENAKHLLPYLHNCVPELPAYDREHERSTLGYTADDLVIISVGRITEGKGADVLADIIARDQEPQHKYLVLGDGDRLSAMKEKLSGQIGSGKVVFTGAVSDVGRYLSASDIYVSTSYKENLSISILEAGYYSLPSIVTPVGGNCEIISSGYNGEFADIADVDDFFESLKKIVNGDIQSYRINAKKQINQYFSREVFEQKLDQIYQRLFG